MVFCDIRRVELGQDGNLLDDVLDFVVCAFDVDDLDCDGLAGAFVDAGTDKGIVSVHAMHSEWTEAWRRTNPL